MKLRNLLLAAFCAALVGCALMDPRGPHGTEVVVFSPTPPATELNVIFIFNTTKFGEHIADQLPHLRSQSFAQDFAFQFGKVTAHNGLKTNVSIMEGSPSNLTATTLTAEVVDVITWHGRINRFKYLWQMRSQEGKLLASWTSVSLWERDWNPQQNSRDYERGVAHLALVSLNTLAENKLARVANSPALTLSGLRAAIF
jgi:hypothetical protein